MTRWKNGVRVEMSDYIKREDAITLICSTESEVAKNAHCDAEWFSRIAKRQHEIIDIIRDMPSADVAPKWIPCEERLPEPNVAVLGYAPKFDNIFAVYYDSVCGWMTWSPVYDEPFPSYQGEIVAWMPLPEPYEGERKDDDTD